MRGEKFFWTLAFIACAVGLLIGTTLSLFTKNTQNKGLELTAIQDIVQRRKDIAEIEALSKDSEQINLNFVNEFGEVNFAPIHNKQVVKIGQGYCRVIGDYMPWETNRYCVEDFHECSDMCKVHNHCVGFAFANEPSDNWDNCKAKNRGRCIVYSEDAAISHQMYASFTSERDSHTRSYDCYRYGENKGFFYFPLSVTREGDSETVLDWSLVMSTQGKQMLVAKTGKGTTTFGGLFEKKNGKYSYYLNFIIHWDEYLASYENLDPVVTFELVGEGRTETYHGRVRTGQKIMHGMLEHAVSTRELTAGHFEFSPSDADKYN
jgi:hypothetical protein